MKSIDTRILDQGTVIDADLCIVGAGAAGICLAAELVGSGIDIAVIEAGSRHYKRRNQALYSGYNVGLPGDPLTLSRFRVLGGSTTQWGGQCGPLNADDFEARPWVPHSGWPFGSEELAPFYRRAMRMFGFGDDEDAWSFSPDRPPLEWPGFPLTAKPFRFCQETDFRPMHARQVEPSANVTTYLNANVVAINPDESGAAIRSLRIRTLNGGSHKVRAKYFVLAAGGIENVRLLLASTKNGRGIGNDADLVGRYFMDHPFFYSGVVTFADPQTEINAHVLEGYDRLDEMDWRLATIQFDADWLRQEKLVNCAAHFLRRPSYKASIAYNSRAGTSFVALTRALRMAIVRGPDWSRHAGNVLRGGGALIKSRLDQLRHVVAPKYDLALRVTLENAPDPSSRIYLSAEKDRYGIPLVKLDWRVGGLERRSLDRFHRLLGEALARSGTGQLELRFEEDETGWPSSLSSGKHHMGGTRMHTDRMQGVVDPNCRMHGISNLYIAGSSVFPTGGYANPTFTIVAMTMRLADHLRIEFAKSRRPVSS